MNLQDYWDRLKNHDWYHTMSDSGSVFKAGRKEEDLLIKISELSPAHKELFDGFVEHYFSGQPWGTPKIDLPVRP